MCYNKQRKKRDITGINDAKVRKTMIQEEITLEALEAQPKDTYLLVDIRDEAAFQFGHMDGAIHIPFGRPSF